MSFNSRKGATSIRPAKSAKNRSTYSYRDSYKRKRKTGETDEDIKGQRIIFQAYISGIMIVVALVISNVNTSFTNSIQEQLKVAITASTPITDLKSMGEDSVSAFSSFGKDIGEFLSGFKGKEIDENDTVEPKTAEPGTAEPGTVEPEIAEPKPTEPGTVEPEIAEPKPTEPSADMPTEIRDDIGTDIKAGDTETRLESLEESKNIDPPEGILPESL